MKSWPTLQHTTSSGLWLLLVAVALPNSPYILAFVLGVGVPPRYLAVVLYMLVTVLLRRAPLGLIAIAYFSVLFVDVLLVITGVFSLAPAEVVRTLRYIGDLDLAQSAFYFLGLLGIGLNSVLVVWLYGRYRAQIQNASLLPALALMAALITADITFNLKPLLAFKQGSTDSSLFTSAVVASGFERAALHGPTGHRLVIMVEGLGVFADTSSAAQVMAPLEAPSLNDDWHISRGTVPHFGSTTAAELREFCGTQQGYQAFIDAPNPDCLPARLAERGYATVALHGFTRRFFARDEWWPNIGWQQAYFSDDLAALPLCGGVWKGACDNAVLTQLADMIVAAEQSTLFYWLTLNTHVPVIPDQHSQPFACTRGGPFGAGQVCHMAAMWHDLFEQIVSLTELGAASPVDILIVGDHVPPLWSRTERALFVQGQVPWVRLHREGTDQPARQTAISIEK